MKTQPNDKFTVREAAIYLGISNRMIYFLTHTRAIPYTKPGGKIIYFDKKDLDEYLERNRVEKDDI